MPRQPNTTDNETQLWKKAAESVYAWVSSEGATGLMTHSITDCVTTYIRKMAHNLYRLAAQHGGNLINPNSQVNQTSWIKSCAYSLYRIAISEGVGSGNLIDPTNRSREDLWIASISLSTYRLALLTGGGTLLNPSSAIQATSRIRSFAFSAYQLATSGGGIPIIDPPVNDVAPVVSGGTAEVTEVEFSGHDGSNLDSQGWAISGAGDTRWGIWYNVDGLGSEPDLSADGVTDYIVVNLLNADVDVQAAQATESLLSSLDFSVSRDGTLLTITCPEIGPKEDSSPGNTSMAVTTTVPGENIIPGTILTCDDGEWTGADSITRNWQHDQGTGTWVNISGETDPTYAVQAIYATEMIRCNVTATNAAGSTSEPSNELGPVSGLVLRLDASELVGFSNNDPVDECPDESGNGITTTQADGAKQFLYKTAVQNGLPALLSDGSNDGMTTDLALGSTFTIFVVWNNTGSGAFSRGPQGATNWFMSPNMPDTGKWTWYAGDGPGAVPSTVSSSATFVVHAVAQDAAGGKQYINGVEDGSAVSPSSPGVLSIGNNAGFGGSFAGHWGEIRVFDTKLDAPNIAEVTAALTDKWGIS